MTVLERDTMEHVQEACRRIAGFTLRDWFAGQYVAGCAGGKPPDDFDCIADGAYKMADAMLKARREK